jgi:hypothetical protein
MCNVKQYRFSCHHYLKLCVSRCGGTKEKKTRTSAIAACCSKPYIYMKLCYECSKCQHDSWLASWKGRLERAIAFRDGLEGLPGSKEVARLVKELEKEYENDAWHIDKIFPHARSKNVGRVPLAPEKTKERRRMRVASLLKHEVQPHEVVLTEEKFESGWIDQGDDDLEDFVASTDPIHPVCTDYTHPLDNDNGSWMLEHFTAEELKRSEVDNDFVIDHSFSNNWGWGWGLGDETTTTEFTTEANTAWDGEASRTGDTTEASDFEKLTAWGPEANTSTTTAQLGLNGIRTEEDETNTIVEETIKAFWRVVNNLPQIKVDMQNTETQDGPSIGTLPFFCSFLRLSLMTSDSDTSDSSDGDKRSDKFSDISTSTSSDTTDTYSIHDLDTCPSLTLKTTVPSDKNTTTTTRHRHFLPRRPSTQLIYDKMREAVQKYRYVDRKVYCNKWLLLSRMEIKAAVGPEGGRIFDPS